MAERDVTVEILMATCNGGRYLREQLDSIFAQSHQALLLRVGDDGSEDATAEILEAYRQRYAERMEIVYNGTRLGVMGNFEALLRRSRADYVAFCDQDDVWEPEKLARELSAMRELEGDERSVPALVHSDLSMIDASGKRRGDSYFRFRGYRLGETKALGQILGPSGVMGNTVLINAALRERLLPFPASAYPHDYWIGIVAELFGRRKTLNEPLVRYRLHDANASNRLETLERKGSWLAWLGGDLKLPYREGTRRELMAHLLGLPLQPEERRVVRAFHDYLAGVSNRCEAAWNLWRYDLIKRGIGTRLKILLKLMVSRRYARG